MAGVPAFTSTFTGVPWGNVGGGSIIPSFQTQPLALSTSSLPAPAVDWSTMSSLPAIPGLGGGAPGGGMGGGLGLNMGTAQMAMAGLQTIGNLWSAFQANKLAKKAFNFQRDFANTNLRNQTQTYNTALEDRGANRAFVQGMSPDAARAWLDKNRLTLPASAQPKSGR